MLWTQGFKARAAHRGPAHERQSQAPLSKLRPWCRHPPQADPVRHVSTRCDARETRTHEEAEVMDELAARLYPDLAKPTEPAAPTPKAEESQPVAEVEQANTDDDQALSPNQSGEPQTPLDAPMTVDELVNQEQTPAQRLYGDGSVRPDSPEGYDTTLGDAFGRLEQQARYDANQEDVQALAEGRKESAAVMHEFGVPREEAGEIVRELGSWHQRAPLSEDANWNRKVKTLGELEKEWGRETHARIELAKRTAAEACKRMPWLADLLKAGAGNDPKLIKRFAEIGLRQARRGKARG